MLDLLERIQASEQEINTHLETVHACQIDGNLMLVEMTTWITILSLCEHVFSALKATGGYWISTMR